MENMDVNLQNEIDEQNEVTESVEVAAEEEAEALEEQQEGAVEEEAEASEEQQEATEPKNDTPEVPDVILEEQEKYFHNQPKGKFLGGVMEFFGFSFAMFFSVALIGLIALYMALDGMYVLVMPILVVAGIVAGLLYMGVKGRQIRGRVKRFEHYKKTLAGREFCDVEELAEAVEKPQEFVVSDLKNMIECGWLLQGHLDPEEKHLMITDTMYEQYTLAMPTQIDK